jgi:uncharacterized membrane protein
MSELIVVAFDTETQAEETRKLLFELQDQYLVEVEDAVTVIKNHEGKISINQIYNLPLSGATGGTVYGGIWGMLIGVLFFNPILGWAVGSVTGATIGGVSGWLTDIGINDDFIKRLGETIKPKSSALFLLLRKVTQDKVLQVLKEHHIKGTVLRTSLSTDDESTLQEILNSKMHPASSKEEVSYVPCQGREKRKISLNPGFFSFIFSVFVYSLDILFLIKTGRISDRGKARAYLMSIV